MFRSFRSQVAIVFLTFALYCLSLGGSFAIRVPAGLTLAFVLPGVAIVAALFPNPTLTNVERCVLVPATSIGSLVLSGLIMHMMGIKLTPTSWSTATALVAVSCAAVAAIRIQGASVVAASRDESIPSTQRPFRRYQSGPLIGLALSVIVLVVASTWSMHSAKAHNVAGFTTLWAINKNNKNDRTRQSVEIGVRNEEGSPVHYNLRVDKTSQPEQNFSFGLADGQTWSSDLQDPPGERVTVQLFKNGESGAYRSVFVNGSQP